MPHLLRRAVEIDLEILDQERVEPRARMKERGQSADAAQSMIYQDRDIPNHAFIDVREVIEEQREGILFQGLVAEHERREHAAGTQHARELRDDHLELMVIGRDLNGYVLDDVAIDGLEQTPIELLDPNNVLDAQGIRKIRSLTDGVERFRGARASVRSGRAAERLRELGLLDVRIALEVSCGVSPQREPLTVVIDGATEAVMARLPPEVTAAVVTAAGRGELTITGDRATFRGLDPDASEDQIVAAARLVHALRGDPGAYR